MEWDYPPYDHQQPVVFNVARGPGGHRARGRRAAEGAAPPGMYVGPQGELLVPAGHRRAASMGGPRPGGIQIVNEQVYVDERQQRNVVYEDDYYYRQPHRSHSRRPRSRVHSHSRSRSRSRSHSRSPMTKEEFEKELQKEEKFKRLEELEKKDEDAKREKQYKEKLLLQKAKEEEDKKEKEAAAKKAVEEWKEKEREKKEKEKEEKEKADKEADEKMRKMLWANGYTDAQIDEMVEKSKKKGKGDESASTSKVLALSRPTYLRINTKYIDIETLEYYQLPWKYADDNNNYIIIKQWVNEHDQEILFEHSRKLREQKRLLLIMPKEKKEKEKGQLVITRKKSNRGKSPVQIIRYR